MSQQGPLTNNTGGDGNIMTLSSEGGPPTPPIANNFNFSGSVAGGSAANGAIEFITPGGPGAATDGQMDAVVRTDNVTIQINGSNDLEVIGGVFGETITGDTGGALSPTAGNWNIFAQPTAGASISFDGAVSTLSLNTTDVNFNSYLGGLVGYTNTTGVGNNGFGYTAFQMITSGSNNCGFGYGTLNRLLTGDTNVAIGVTSLGNLASSNNNVGVGYATLVNLLTGANNTAIGTSAGSSLTGSEDSNILINNTGTILDNHTIRIGTQGAAAGQQNRCFVAGIVGVTVSNQQSIVIDSTSGQLGVSSGSFANNYTDVTFAMSPYTVVATDQYISCDTSGGAITLNFPNAPTANRTWVVKDRTGNAGANTVTITTPGGVVTFDGSATFPLNTAYASVNLLANATPTYEVY